MAVGLKIWDGLVELEKKMWNREDYSEDDITLLSNAMDYIEENKEDFYKYFNDKEAKEKA